MDSLSTRISTLSKTRRRRHGVGLVELLIALAISAALLVSVAVAVDASFKAYAVNQDQAQLMQRARIAMNRMVTYIRGTDDHLPKSDTAYDDFIHGKVTSDNAIEMLLDSSHGISFRQSGTQLQMVSFWFSGATQVYGTPRTLLEGVGTADFVVKFEPQRSAKAVKTGNPLCDQLKRATISLTVRPATTTTVAGEDSSDQPVTLSACVMPRKNIW